MSEAWAREAQSDAAEPIIALEGASRSYGDGPHVVHALRDVTLHIAPGTYAAIVGPSGSGKSTMLNLIGALDRPTAGQVRVAGQLLNALDDKARTIFRRQHIGFVFQFFNLLPTLTAAENVVLPALLAGRPAKQARARAEALLGEVGLGERAKHYPHELSGGEMQRVAISRALMMDPPVIVADEPTGNLDSATGQAILALLRGSIEDHRTVVLVTHDPKIAAQADQVIQMRDGSVEHDSTQDASAQNERVQGSRIQEAQS